MRLTVVSPATNADLADVVSATGQNPALWTAGRVQIALGQSWAGRDENGVAVAIVGVIALNDAGDAEAWLLVAPAASRLLLAIVKRIRLTLATAAYRSLRVIVTTAEGARLARLCGLNGDADGQPVRRRRSSGRATGAVASGSGGGAVPPAGRAVAAPGVR